MKRYELSILIFLTVMAMLVGCGRSSLSGRIEPVDNALSATSE